MKITNKKLVLKISPTKYMASIQNEIRDNLERMGVDGLSIDIRYDAGANIALVRFMFKGKNYEMKVGNQADVRRNMFAISKRVEYKARLHLLGIEPFEVSVSPYLQLENQSGISGQEGSFAKASPHSYAVLGIPEYSSNNQIKSRFKELVKTFHPDMALSDEAKTEFQNRMSEINNAYAEIKKERGVDNGAE
jgi:hypothetical protein